MPRFHMDTRDAVALLAGAVPREAGTWADLGAGTGTFTRALVELLGATARIYAVDRDASAVATLARWARKAASNVSAPRECEASHIRRWSFDLANFVTSLEIRGIFTTPPARR